MPDAVSDVWKTLAPELKRNRHVAYVRDMPSLTIGGKYPLGYAPNEFEFDIAVNKWPVDKVQIVDTFAHELHHLARWQHGGYGESLGQVLITEGMACWFAEEQSGWTAPWTKGKVPPAVWKQVRRLWNDHDINHEEWFLKGPLGKWVGYRTGYHLAKRILGNSFNLHRSIHTTDRQGKVALPK